MAKKEFTKQELIELLNEHSEDDKVSFEGWAAIVFDPRFPEELFTDAKDGIIQARDDEKRIREISEIVYPKMQQMLEWQKEIVELSRTRSNDFGRIEGLREKVAKMEQEISPLEAEMLEIKKRIDERQGKM